MNDGQRPLSVGFFFSLGHSSIVFGLTCLLSFGVKALAGPVRNGSSSLHQVTTVVGTGVAGTFLYVIAAIKLVLLAGILKVVLEMPRRGYDDAGLEKQLDIGGLMDRLLGLVT